MSRPRAADDFTSIRARMEELRRERDGEPETADARPGQTAAMRRESDAERRRRERIEGWPPPWVPTIFVKQAARSITAQALSGGHCEERSDEAISRNKNRPDRPRRTAMLIVDSQIHIWENAKMSAHHRQIPTYSEDDALKEMAEAGVDAAVLHPPSTLGEAMNELAVTAVRQHPDKFCILGNFDLEAPNREEIVRNWRQRPGMLGFRFTFNQPQQKAWWTDGSARLVLGRLRAGESCRSGCSPAAIWRRSARSPSAIPG